MDNWRLTSKNHGYPCGYPWIFGNTCMDMLWILGPGPAERSESRESKPNLTNAKLEASHVSAAVTALLLFDLLSPWRVEVLGTCGRNKFEKVEFHHPRDVDMQGMTTYDIRCTNSLDIRLISSLSGYWVQSKHGCFQRFFRFFYSLTTVHWYLARYIQQIFINILL